MVGAPWTWAEPTQIVRMVPIIPETATITGNRRASRPQIRSDTAGYHSRSISPG
jgi:hypothetical protein